MEEQKENDIFTLLKKDLSDYINLKINDYKLRGVETLSTLINKIIFIILVIVLCGVALQLFALSIGYLLGDFIGSRAGGFAIVGGIIIVVVLICYLFRNKLFINSFVKTFIKLFWRDENKEQ